MIQFHVGQKVVCIADWTASQHQLAQRRGVTLPVEGTVYTIRSIQFIEGHGVHLCFYELVNPVEKFRGHGRMEQSFGADKFRPIVTRKTSIEIFTDMLNKAPEEVPA